MEEIVTLAERYFDTIKRLEALPAIRVGEPDFDRLNSKARDEWEKLRDAVQKHRVATQPITAPDRLRATRSSGG